MIFGYPQIHSIPFFLALPMRLTLKNRITHMHASYKVVMKRKKTHVSSHLYDYIYFISFVRTWGLIHRKVLCLIKSCATLTTCNVSAYSCMHACKSMILLVHLIMAHLTPMASPSWHDCPCVPYERRLVSRHFCWYSHQHLYSIYLFLLLCCCLWY